MRGVKRCLVRGVWGFGLFVSDPFTVINLWYRVPKRECMCQYMHILE